MGSPCSLCALCSIASLADAYVRAITLSQTPIDDAYYNALLLAHWPVRQKLNRVSSVQFGYVALYMHLSLVFPIYRLSHLSSTDNKLNLCKYNFLAGALQKLSLFSASGVHEGTNRPERTA